MGPREPVIFDEILCLFSGGEVSTPVERTTTVFFPGKGASQSMVEARLDDSFNWPKQAMKFKFFSASRSIVLSGVSSRSSSGSFDYLAMAAGSFGATLFMRHSPAE